MESDGSVPHSCCGTQQPGPAPGPALLSPPAFPSPSPSFSPVMPSCAQRPAPLPQRAPQGHPLGQDPLAPYAPSPHEHHPTAHRGHCPMAPGHLRAVGLQAQRCCFPAFPNTPDDNRRKKTISFYRERNASHSQLLQMEFVHPGGGCRQTGTRC